MANNTNKDNSFASTALAAKTKVMEPHEVILSSNLQNAVGIQAWGKFAGNASLQAIDESLGAKTRKVTDGDIRPIEGMLYRQAKTLESIFTNLATRAAGNTSLKQFQVNLTLALKAQAQCRAMGVDRRILDFASSAGPSGMFWVPDTLGRELKIDNTRPLLADWQIDADDKGIPSLKVSQAVGPGTDLLLIMKNGGAGVNVTVLAVLAKDAPEIDRQSAFPVGNPLEIEFMSDDFKVVAKATPLVSWKLVRKTKDGGAVFGGAAVISHADLQRMAKLQKLQITDNFSNSIRDLSISTNLSTKKLASGAELLMRTK